MVRKQKKKLHNSFKLVLKVKQNHKSMFNWPGIKLINEIYNWFVYLLSNWVHRTLK